MTIKWKSPISIIKSDFKEQCGLRYPLFVTTITKQESNKSCLCFILLLFHPTAFSTPFKYLKLIISF